MRIRKPGESRIAAPPRGAAVVVVEAGAGQTAADADAAVTNK